MLAHVTIRPPFHPRPAVIVHTKALLVDDHPLFRDGIAMLIGLEFPQWELAQAGSLEEALLALRQDPEIAIVMLDLALPDSEGLMGLTRLRLQSPGPRYVVLSSTEGEHVTLAAIDNGACGFIPKSSQTGTMLGALRTVLQGGVFLPSGIRLAAATPPLLQAEGSTAERLGISPRQADILTLLVEGKTNKHICRELGIAESTVKTHLGTIFRKLGANSRTQAVVAAARMGLRLEPPSGAG